MRKEEGRSNNREEREKYRGRDKKKHNKVKRGKVNRR